VAKVTTEATAAVKAAARAAVAWAVARAEEQAREKARAEEAHRVSLFRNACVRPEDARQKRWRSRAEPSRRSVRSSKLVYSANDVVTATSQRAGAPFCETASRREGHAPRRDAPITPLVCAQHARPVGRADPLDARVDPNCCGFSEFSTDGRLHLRAHAHGHTS
jgi:hypothetical protein